MFQSLCEHFFFSYSMIKNVERLRGNRKYSDLPHVANPMSVTLCHPVSFTFNLFIDYMCTY